MEKPHALIASANGYGNAGDDICAVACRSLLSEFMEPSHITITSPPIVQDKVHEADIVVLGGGGIIYDAHPDNVENYLSYLDLAISLNKKTLVLGVGEQGIVTKKGGRRYAKTLKKVDGLTVRSSLDADKLEQHGMNNAVAAQDLAFSYTGYKKHVRSRKRRLWAEKFLPRRQKNVAIVISNQEHLVSDLKLAFSTDEKKNASRFKDSLLKYSPAIADKHNLTIISQSKDDLELVEKYKKASNCNTHIYHDESDLDNLLKTYAKQDLIISQRFHGIVFSLMLGVPVAALGYHGQKQYRLLKDLGLERSLYAYHQPGKIDDLLSLITGKDVDSTIGISLNQEQKNFLEESAAINRQVASSIF